MPAQSPASSRAAAAKNNNKEGPISKQHPQLPPFRWGLALGLIAGAVLLISVSLQWADNFRAQQRASNPKPPASTFALDIVPRGDDANPEAVYRLRGYNVVPTGQRHVVNFSTITETQLVACASALAPPVEVTMSACVPRHHLCTRIIVDSFVSDNTADNIVRIMKNILRRYGNGGGSGPVSLVDLNMGVVSLEDKFVSLVHLLKRSPAGSGTSAAAQSLVPALTIEDVDTYHLLVKKIHAYVSETLFCDTTPCATERDRELARRRGRESLFVAGPSFFSQIGGSASDGAEKFQARTVNDEYWHEHVDQDQYGTFAITTLLYLNTMKDAESLDTFEGGQFEFGAPLPGTVEPRKGRLSVFTSGREHPHWVAPVLEGYRYALTTAFTCTTPSTALQQQQQVFYVEGGKGDLSFLHNIRQAL